MRKSYTLLILLLGFMRMGMAQTCEVPPNYFQNPNFEHNLSPLVWTGAWDSPTWGAMQPYSNPEFWLTDTTAAHSGAHSMVITGGSWIWPTVSTVGFQEKDMKMSFWFKSPIGKMGFWMFFYRDAKLTPEEVRAPLKEYLVGADSAYITITAGTDNEEALYFELPCVTEWTYFEFKYSNPGSIPGPTMTLMFYSEYTPGFIDDVYYGVDFPCVYNGEEDLEIKNPDFEADVLGLEWLINTPGGSSTDFLTANENHTESGYQSLQLWGDYYSTYSMPVLGAQGKEMNLNYWYKGNASTLAMNIYKDYGITPEDLAVPSGASLVVDSIVEYVEDTIAYSSDTFKIFKHDVVLSEVEIGKNQVITPGILIDTLEFQNFENPDAPPLPIDGNWSGYYYPDWATAMPKGQFFSPFRALWIPADPGWTGVWGSPGGFKDGYSYSFSFMYKGRFKFELSLGRDFKYDLIADPQNIVPDDATVVADGVDHGNLHWNLQADEWTEFSYAWNMGTWLADSSITSPTTLGFKFFGVDDNWVDAGYVDNLLISVTKDAQGSTNAVSEVPRTTKTYELDYLDIQTVCVIGVVDTLLTLDPVGFEWALPAVTGWTPFTYNWNNPAGDIGSTLTFTIASGAGQGADTITYFDDFNYSIVTGISKNNLNNVNARVYPNPVLDNLNIELKSAIKNAGIYNATGQLVRKIDYPGRQINVSGLSRGIYMIRFTDENGVNYQSKFIKQ
jgi:hypothetical protein